MKHKEHGTPEPKKTSDISSNPDDSIPTSENNQETQSGEKKVSSQETASSNQEPMESYPVGYVAQLQAKLKQAEEQAEMLQVRFKQAQQDVNREADELRARLRRSADEKLETAKGEIYQRMLEFSDNLERAIKSAEANADLIALLEGVKATHQLFLKELESRGLVPIQAVGESFDPQIHEAVDILIVEPQRDGQVTAVYKAGYKLGNKLLRPAIVQVGRSN